MDGRILGFSVCVVMLAACPATRDSRQSVLANASKPDAGQTSTAGRGSAASAGSGSCVQNELCIRDKHWDRQRCACVADSDADAGSAPSTDADAGPAAGTGPDAGSPACVQNQLCVREKHWDTVACMCVADGTDADAGTPFCVDNQLCIRGAHWDTARCMCVVDP